MAVARIGSKWSTSNIYVKEDNGIFLVVGWVGG